MKTASEANISLEKGGSLGCQTIIGNVGLLDGTGTNVRSATIVIAGDGNERVSATGDALPPAVAAFIHEKGLYGAAARAPL